MKILLILLLSLTYTFGIIDINSATEEEFTKLKGVGIKKAKNIILYRKSIKCFNTVDELIKVKGIGTKTILKNRNNIEVKSCNRNIKKKKLSENTKKPLTKI